WRPSRRQEGPDCVGAGERQYLAAARVGDVTNLWRIARMGGEVRVEHRARVVSVWRGMPTALRHRYQRRTATQRAVVVCYQPMVRGDVGVRVGLSRTRRDRSV